MPGKTGVRGGSRTQHEEKSAEGLLRASCLPVLPYRGVLSTSCTKSGLFGQAQTFDQGEYLESPVITNLTGKEIWIESQGKRIIFQIGYSEKELHARAELFRCCGHEVISVADNEAAKRVLVSIQNVDVFVVGHTATEQERRGMVDWLKANFPKVKIVALIPSANSQVPRADCNVVLNDSFEWSSLLAAATS